MSNTILPNFASTLLFTSVYLCVFHIIVGKFLSRRDLIHLNTRYSREHRNIPLHRRATGYSTEETSSYLSFLDSPKSHPTTRPAVDPIPAASNLQQYSQLIKLKSYSGALYTIGLLFLVHATHMTSISYTYALFIITLAITFFIFENIEGRFLLKTIEMVSSDEQKYLLSENLTPYSPLQKKPEIFNITHNFHRLSVSCSLATVIKCWTFRFSVLFILLGSLSPKIDYIWIHY